MAAPTDPAAGTPAPIDRSEALAYNQSIIRLAASMGVAPDLIFNPARELRASLIEVHEHVITLDPFPSPAPSNFRGPGDDSSSYWVKVSSANELWNCCAADPLPLNYRRILHVHLLPSIPIEDVDTIDDWEMTEDCSNVRIYVINRVQALCKIDALEALGSIREAVMKSKDNIEDVSISLRLRANDKSKEVSRLNKSHLAYVAVRDSKQSVNNEQLDAVRSEAIIASRPLVVAKVSLMSLSQAADTTRALVDSMSSKVDRIDELLKALTLMGCGHPEDDFGEPQLGHEDDEGNREQGADLGGSE